MSIFKILRTSSTRQIQRKSSKHPFELLNTQIPMQAKVNDSQFLLLSKKSNPIQTAAALCPICMANVVDITLGCGHAFCSTCVKEHVKPKYTEQYYQLPDGQVEVVRTLLNNGCPLCRAPISQLDKNVSNWRDFQKKHGKKKGQK
jgi:hypothetical protein